MPRTYRGRPHARARRLGSSRLALSLLSAGLLAGCATSAHTSGSASSTSGAGTSSTATAPSTAPTTSSTTTSSTLAASAVSITKAPVLVARTADGNVGYRIVGAGPPLVMIMGYSGTMDSWEPSFVDALGRSHRVVIFDNSGIGKTTSLPSPLTVTAMADQVAALIQCLHLGRVDLLGWSMGGMIAQAVADVHPTLVRRLVLCATFPGNGKSKAPSSSASSALSNPSAGNATALLGLLFPKDQQKALRYFVKQITSFPGFYLAPPTVDKAQLGAIVSWLFGKEPAGHRIALITAPTLVADGAADLLDPATNDRELASVIPGAQLVLYPDAGHGFLFQDAGVFLPRVEAFFGD